MIVFQIMGTIGIAFFFLYGVLAFWQDTKPIKQTLEVLDSGFDTSNRFNRMKARWLVGREPWRLAKYNEFAFMRLDVGDQAEIIADHFSNSDEEKNDG